LLTLDLPSGFEFIGLLAICYPWNTMRNPEINPIDPLLECLLFLGNFHGCPSTSEALTAGLPLEHGLLSPSLFSRAARRSGFNSKLIHKPLAHINRAHLPLILLLEDEQACVLVGWSECAGKAKVVYPDMNGSVTEVSREELESFYLGTAILVRPEFRFDDRAPALSKDNQGHWLWSALKENLPLYRDVLVAALFINLFAVAMPLFTMNVYDRVVPNHALETLWMLAAGVAVVLCFDLVLKTMRGYFLDLASKRIDIKLSGLIMERVLGLRMEVRPPSVGSFAANLRSFETIRDFITSATITAIIDLPFTVIFLLVLGWISPWLMLPLLAGVCVVLLYALTTRQKMEQLTETTYRASAMRNATLIESLVGLETVKVMTCEGMMQKRWERSASFLARVGVQLRLLATSNGHVTSLMQQLVTLGVVVTGVYLIAAGELTMGALIASSMLSGRAMAPLGQMAALLTQYHGAKTAYQSLNDLMRMPIERPAESRFLSRTHFKGKIEFRNLSFSYPDTETPVLKNVSFTVEPGEHVAILGRIGSGKSTLQRLVMGLYQPTEGAVLIDGVDSRQLDPAELRRQIGYVPQDVVLMYGSLRENIVMSHPQADDEAVVRAAEMANLSDFVNRHPQGFDMQVGERGEVLSGGQRKSVAIARAVISEPPMLLMDEPTGSMDHATEAWVIDQFKEYAKDRTTLLVTHRTSLLALVDRIIVVDGGQVVADGPREQVVQALRQGRIGRAS
jgi:ATP-binding cassette, subfamily C, bacterial LapB